MDNNMTPNNGKGAAVAGLVLGIIALVLRIFLGGWLGLVVLALSIVGLVLSVNGGKKLKAAGQPAGVATAGLVLGIIAVVLSALLFLTCDLCIICAVCAAASL